MKVGIEFNHGFRLESDSFEQLFRRAVGMGAQCGQFKNPTFLSPTLDKGELREIKAMATEIGLDIHAGLGRINPYNTSEMPGFWELGGGSYKKGCERIIEACAEIGSHNLVSQAGGWRGYTLPQPYNTDRFREDVEWRDQLEATKKFLKKLAPVLRHYGSNISVETHEEITSFEVLEIIEEVGPDVVSATLDTGNVVARGEDPVAAARRLAPHVKMLHAKDVLLWKSEKGLVRNVRPAGDGVVDFQSIADILAKESPDAMWNIEDHMGEMFIDYQDEFWCQHHPDLRQEEIEALKRMSEESYAKVARGEITAPEVYEQLPFDLICIPRMERGLRYLKPIVCNR